MGSTKVRWPGIPEEHAKPFKNVEYLDDLFSWAEAEGLFEEANTDHQEIEPDPWESRLDDEEVTA